jgi:hypothetical protein
VADIATDVDGVVTADGAWGAVLGVCGTEDDAASLDGVTAFPDHGADGAGCHICGLCMSVLVDGGGGRGGDGKRGLWERRTGDETGEEGLLVQVFVVLLEVLLGGCDELETDELEAVVVLSANL